MYFVGCPECKKKCVTDGNQFRCENCNKYLKPNETRLTYTVVAKFDDMSDSLFASFLSETADPVMGMNASEFRDMREN